MLSDLLLLHDGSSRAVRHAGLLAGDVSTICSRILFSRLCVVMGFFCWRMAWCGVVVAAYVLLDHYLCGPAHGRPPYGSLSEQSKNLLNLRVLGPAGFSTYIGVRVVHAHISPLLWSAHRCFFWGLSNILDFRGMFFFLGFDTLPGFV